MKTNTLVIGAGRRVKNTILPALECMSKDFTIVGVYSRTQITLDELSEKWNLKTSNNINDFDFHNINLIIVAITTDNIPDVLSKLSKYDLKKVTLMLDTPVLSHKHFYCINQFKNYDKVLVSEDCIALPQFLIAKEIIEKGQIGKLRKIWLFHSGFKYHGIALIRSLVSRQHILKAKSTKHAENYFEYTLVFPDFVTATIIEPKDYSIGRFMIAGSKGIITDYKLNCPGNIQIGYTFEEERLIGFTINGVLKEPSNLDKAFFENLSYNKFQDKSLMNILKIRGLMEILDSLKHEHSELQYNFSEGLYDAILIKVVSVFNFWYDIFAYLNLSLLKLFLIYTAPK